MGSYWHGALTDSQSKFQGTVIACNYSIVGSALFVVIFFPMFFRMSLVEPLYALLKAVDRVNSGERELELPVLFTTRSASLRFVLTA